MLITNFPLSNIGKPNARQSGAVLIIALIILVAMTLAAIAMVRSVDTTNLIAGNLAFQQAAIHSGDAGVEAAIGWLEKCKANSGGCESKWLNEGSAKNGYFPDGSSTARSPAVGQSWDAYWATLSPDNIMGLSKDGAGNEVFYIIDRMCAHYGAPTGGGVCMASPVITAATGNAEEGGEVQINAPSMVYYRITVRVAGPRNTVSYIQAMVAM